MIDLQFRVLYREFFFRMVDLEVLSADALGDANRLLGRFAALLVTLSVFLALHALEMAGSDGPATLRYFDALRYEHFLIATTMLVVGLFAVLSWDSTFPDRRDVLVLAPLPVRARTLFWRRRPQLPRRWHWRLSFCTERPALPGRLLSACRRL